MYLTTNTRTHTHTHTHTHKHARKQHAMLQDTEFLVHFYCNMEVFLSEVKSMESGVGTIIFVLIKEVFLEFGMRGSTAVCMQRNYVNDGRKQDPTTHT